VGPRDGLDGCGKSRSPDRPARSQSLYRLSYPGPLSEERTASIFMVEVRFFHASAFSPEDIASVKTSPLTQRSAYKLSFVVCM